MEYPLAAGSQSVGTDSLPPLLTFPLQFASAQQVLWQWSGELSGTPFIQPHFHSKDVANHRSATSLSVSTLFHF
jgi:hypothetical protein